jgi:SAM-dependent methyltransferase
LKLAQRLDRSLYPDHGDRWDDALFRRVLLTEISPDDRVLDLGAGAGIVPEMNFRGVAARVCGVDPDPRVADNPYLDEAEVGVGESVPYPDGSFDLVFADNVLEHLEDPRQVFAEVARLLAPGGRFLVKTPNRWHYVALAARWTPHRFHRAYNRRRGRTTGDTFPTRYLANRPRRLRELAAGAGLRVRSIELIEGRPEYLRTWAPAYLLGWLYERAVNRLPALRGFRVVMIAVFEKPE